MDINQLRNKIDSIDEQLVSLFVQRMEIASQVAAYKEEHNLPIYVPTREREILQSVAKMAGSDFDNYARVLYSMIFELSRSYQRKQNTASIPLHEEITNSINNTPKLFPQAPMVACQGVEGAFAQIACEKVFKNPKGDIIKFIDEISKADLLKLREDCRKVLEHCIMSNGEINIDKTYCKNIFPCLTGYFTGSVLYDQYFIEDIKNAMNDIDRLLLTSYHPDTVFIFFMDY